MFQIIHLNKDNPYWTSDGKCNEAFVSSMIDYIYDRRKAEGGMYLSDICAAFGGKLDPREFNCYITPSRTLRYSTEFMNPDIKILVIY